MSDGLQEHRARAPRRLGFAVVTVSDTRDEGSDRGGAYLAETLAGAGHAVAHREIVRDEAPEIRAALTRSLETEGVDLVLFTGGTGIAPRDVTTPTLEAQFESTIPGFGELFRWLSYAEIGSATILSRATCGVMRGRVIFALPGSPKALRLAMEKIILPEAGHLVAEVRGRG